ncbi:MAG: Tad domain-containing protein [Pseudomonadota bacterium]|nr:Tad domain-containing protein [Pseudomonadota bacterium]
MAIIVALGLTTLLAVGAVTIDLSYARVVQQQLQNASEAGARAGSQQLDGTDAGMIAARVAAANVAAENNAAGTPVEVASADIVLGIWDDEAGTFEESDEPTLVNTVEVRARRPELALFLAPVALGRSTVVVSAQSRALAEASGAGAVSCYIPLAVPDCLVEQHGLGGLEDLTLQINPPGVDSVGWARPNGSPNANWSRDQMDDCENGGEAAVGDPVGLQNGVVSSAMDALATRVNTSSTSWSTERWGSLPNRLPASSISTSNFGNTYEGAVIVFDGGDEYCDGSGGDFNGTQPLKGFLWGAIYDVRNTGAADKRTIKMRLDTSTGYNIGTGIGGPDYGVVTHSPPRLVRND